MKILISIVLLLLFSACATKERGLFNSYIGLKKIDKNFYFEQTNEANLSAYDKVFVPEVKLMINQGELKPAQHQLNMEIKAYATQKYRKKISHYKRVDIRQKGTIELRIALSLASLEKNKKGLNALNFRPISPSETEEKLYLVVETEAIDVMTLKRLSRCVRIVSDKSIDTSNLSFKEIQPSLDSWLSTTIRY